MSKQSAVIYSLAYINEKTSPYLDFNTTLKINQTFVLCVVKPLCSRRIYIIYHGNLVFIYCG